jgi:hypothetical protein
LGLQGLLRARSRLPEFVENIENVKEGMEILDGSVELAKQVLCQLSYTPTAGTFFDSKAFPRGLKSIPCHFWSLLFQNPLL